MLEKIKKYFSPTKTQRTYSRAEKLLFLIQQEFDIDEQSSVIIEIKSILITQRKNQIESLTNDLVKLESI